jgi:hypothetical protein
VVGSLDVLQQWFTEIRPLFGSDDNPSAWPFERGYRVGIEVRTTPSPRAGTGWGWTGGWTSTRCGIPMSPT